MRWATYIGIPYAHLGRDRATGVDCWGLVRLVYAERYGITLPSYSYADASPLELDALISEHHTDGWRAVGDPQEGDVVLLRQLRTDSHVGVLCAATHFLHVEAGTGVVRQALDDPRWARRVVSYHRHRDLEAVRVVTCPSPLSDRRVASTLAVGVTITALVTGVVEERWREYCHVTVQGAPVPPDIWPTTRVQRGALVTVRVVPRGGAKGLLRSVLTLAVMIWAGGAGGKFFAGLLHSSAAVGSAVAGMAGLLVVNAIAPPTMPKLENLSGTGQSNMYSIQGAQNRVNQYGAVPVILGEHRVYPPYAAKPYTLLDGDDQYLCCLFAVGYGPLTISDLRIGETAIASFDDVEHEIREGTAGDAAITLFPESVDEQTLSIALTYAAGAQTRTTVDDTEQGSVDITFPKGLVRIRDDGSPTWRAAILEIAYRENGVAGAWSNPIGYYVSSLAIANKGSGYTSGRYDLVFTGGGGTGAAGKAYIGRSGPFGGGDYTRRVELTEQGRGYTSAPIVTLPGAAGGEGAVITASMGTGAFLKATSTAPKRYGFTFDFAAKAKWDVRCTRTSADATSDRDVDEMWWTALRSIENEAPVDTPYHLAKIALKIRATDQLNGMISSLSCIAKSRCEKWDSGGSAWVADQVTSNPADLFRYLLQGPFNARPVADGRIDLTQLAMWSEFCDTKGFEFNVVLDSAATLRERLQAVAAGGRASPAMSNNKFSVVIDDTQATAVQLFTPRNCKSFSAARIFITYPHALKIRFINADNDYLQEERTVYADGKNAGNSTIFERLDLFGVTDPEQVWKLGRYYLAVGSYRQHQYIIDVDWEHLVCTRGDLVLLEYEVPLLGIAGGRVKAVTADELTVDEVCTMELGETYGVQVRKADGTVMSRAIVTDAGEQTVLARDGGAAFDCALGDVFAFGETGSVTLSCLVQAIEHLEDLAARLVLIPYSADVYTADAGAVPAYVAQQTLPEVLRWPGAPRTLTAAEHMYREDGTLVQGVILQWVHADDTVPDHYEVQILRPSSNDFEAAGLATATQFRIPHVPAGTYSFRVRTVVGLRASAWVLLEDEAIDDLATTLSNVEDLRTAYRNGKIVVVWAEVADIRSVEYEVRLGTSWAAGTTVALQLFTEYSPLVDGTYMVSARAGGAYSATPASIVLVGLDLPANVIEAVDERADGWRGTFSGGAYPELPTAVEHDYDPGWEAGFAGWDVEYDGSVEPDADGWALFSHDNASSDGDILTIGPVPAGQVSSYFRAPVVTADRVLVVVSRQRIESGQLHAELYARSKILGRSVKIEYSSDTQIRVNGGGAIAIGDCTVFHEIRIEVTSYWYRVIVNDELVSEGTPAAWAVDELVWFGVMAPDAKKAYWDYVDYAACDVAFGDLNAEPDAAGPGWTRAGADIATVLGDYLQMTPVGATSWYQKTPAPSASNALYLRCRARSTSDNSFVCLCSPTLGTGVEFRFDCNGVCSIQPAGGGAPIDQFSLTGSHAHRFDLILDTNRYWLCIDDVLVSSGTPAAWAGAERICWGTRGGTGNQWWYHVRAGVIAAHLLALRADGYHALVSHYTTAAANQIDLGADGTVLAAASVGYHGSTVTARLVDLFRSGIAVLDNVGVGESLVDSTDLVAEADLLFLASADVTVESQIRIRRDGGAWGDWQTYVAGEYTGRYFDVRLRITVADADTTAIVTAFDWSIDMADRIEQDRNVATAAVGTVITFGTAFQVTPSIQVTQVGAVAGDTVVVSAAGTAGFTVQILNVAGVGKMAVVDWIAKGY